MGLFSFTNITCGLFVVYFAFVAKNIYDIYNPTVCPTPNSRQCIKSIPNWQKQFSISLCIPKSGKARFPPSSTSHCAQIAQFSDRDGDDDQFTLDRSFSKNLTIQLPKWTTNNGTCHGYVVVTQKSNFLELNDLEDEFMLGPQTNTYVKRLDLSRYRVNATDNFVNLLGDVKGKVANDDNDRLKQKEGGTNSNNNNSNNNNNNKPITHLLGKLSLMSMNSQIDLLRTDVPEELYNDLQLTGHGKYYLPIVHIDTLSMKDDHFLPMRPSNEQTNFTLLVEHSASSVGTIRFYKQIEMAIQAMKALGFSDKQLKEVISLFTDTDLYLLGLTFVVSLFHSLFEFLAFKNDIKFWRKRKTTIGLSLQTLVWRAFTQTVILAYLYEEESSLLILVPAGISLLIELWKLKRAFKVKIEFSNFAVPRIKFGEQSAVEKASSQFDSLGMKRLSYVLYPLCVAGAIYSLVYNTHKSWWSWLINSLVNGIYAFGFLFMTPQLFLNYKLKSVAHLPWRVFMYKAFNTFIDDIFAFIIKMPTMHRLACLRDDFVFLIYLYQRYLYPIDKKRVNEYGEAYEDEKEKEKTPLSGESIKELEQAKKTN